MTTIAYKDGVLCADRLVNDDGVRVGTIDKISKHGSWLYAASGRLNVCNAFLVWAAGDQKTDPPSHDISDNVKLVRIQGHSVQEWHGAHWDFVHFESHIAFGSGWRIAMGAMEAGASAWKAIEIASKLDVYTGGGITELRL